MSGWSRMRFTVSCVPCTMLSTPLGRPGEESMASTKEGLLQQQRHLRFQLQSHNIPNIQPTSALPASSASSARIMAAPGSRSEGFSTMLFPAAVASGNSQSGIMAAGEEGRA